MFCYCSLFLSFFFFLSFLLFFVFIVVISHSVFVSEMKLFVRLTLCVFLYLYFVLNKFLFKPIKFNESIVLFGHDANFRSDDVLDLVVLLAMALCLYLPM